MKTLVIAGLVLVVAVEVVTVVLADRSVVLWVSGGVAALVLLAGRRLLSRAPTTEPTDSLADGPAELVQRWISKTEAMIRWADSSRAEWDRRLRPRLAREFMMATGQKQTRDPAAFQATGRMVFGDELWQWVDPSNVGRTDGHEPGPGRGTLCEILQRLERV